MLKRENRLAKITHRADEMKYFSPLFNVRITDNKDNKVRFGFVVSKKIDKKAVVRNRTKRVLRDTAKDFLKDLASKDIVVVAKKSLSFKEKPEVLREFKNIFNK
jgi:ribonuclease P protein component